MSGVVKVTVAETEDGMRLDRWFKLHVERVMWYYALGW